MTKSSEVKRYKITVSYIGVRDVELDIVDTGNKRSNHIEAMEKARARVHNSLQASNFIDEIIEIRADEVYEKVEDIYPKEWPTE